ncbi:porin family protein [Acetobacteroides hydrogenigenes]|uniref:Outer membrane protein with beta-barrel domain n=1 Tax=Acetobacteroides hydrogenigenes TaxID=979970 RepID=A0A4R2ETC1_9BACT|nr:porin family protein [Acetobacteroides hydrogenigenes]TCN70712.1 outer membrane protein with beta-barrel domain [Acetobacteroides hydrogenigenes]
MKKVFLVVAIALAAVAANAQVKFGPKVGLNFSTMSSKGGGFSADAKMRTGYQIGMVFQGDIAPNVFVQPSILFSSKGSKYDNGLIEKVVANYIDVPVNFGYRINLGGANLNLLAGPYFAYGVGGKVTSTLDVILGKITVEEDIKWGSDKDKDHFKPFDMGINLGGGVEFNSFQVSLQYGFGLLNINPNSDITNKNGVLSLSAAFLF